MAERVTNLLGRLHEAKQALARRLPPQLLQEKATQLEESLYPSNQDLAHSLPEHLLHDYILVLESVKRGQASDIYVMNRHMHETNYGHVLESVKILHDIENNFPAITQGMNLTRVELQILTHDIGEGITSDVPACGEGRESRDGQRRKRLEPIVAIRYMFPKIPDDKTRVALTNAYLRFIKNDPNDSETQLAHLIDKMQGTTRGGLRWMFSRWRNYGYSSWKGFEVESPPPIMGDHISKTLPKMVEPGDNLNQSLSDIGQSQLSLFINMELARMIQYGYKPQVDQVREQFPFLQERVA